MKKILVSLLILTFSLGATTNWQQTNVAGKSKRTIAMALGSELTTTLTGTPVSSITLNVSATTGRGNLPQVMSLSNVGVAVSTIDVFVLTDVAVGDVLILKTNRASEDVYIKESGTILLGATSRLLSDPADEIWLRKYNSTSLKEVGFFDNN